MDKSVAFDKFKSRCDAEGLLKDEANNKGGDPSLGVYDDGTLLRYLRARNYDVDAALEQYKATRVWRDANQLIDLYENIDVNDFDKTRQMYTHWIGRRDRNGIPIFVFEIGKLTPKVMSAYQASCAASNTSRGTRTESEATLRLFCMCESSTRFIMPLCTAVNKRKDPEALVTHTTCIVDMSGVSIMQFLRLRTHMQAASVLSTAHYPETLGKLFIVGAPSFFSMVWNWINGWFDQNTVSKISIIPHGEELSVMSELIDPINLPKKYGGQFDYEFGMRPDLDSEIVGSIKRLDDNTEAASQLPMGPMRWIDGKDGERVALAVGTEDGKQRNFEFLSLKP